MELSLKGGASGFWSTPLIMKERNERNRLHQNNEKKIQKLE